jgi:hypothetical protein
MISYLGVDPGAATGWAIFNELGLPTGRGIERGVDNFAEWIANCDAAETIIYEDFRLFPHKAIAQVGSRMEASQVIGILKLKAKEWGATLVAQAPQCYKVGELWSGKKVGAHKDSHDLVAYNHVFYYLSSHGIIPTKGRRMVNLREEHK